MDEKGEPTPEPTPEVPAAPEAKSATPAKAAPEEVACEACGATNTEADEVCRSCGEELWEEEGDDAGTPDGWKPLVIGATLAALVLGLFLWKPWARNQTAAGTTGTAAGSGGGPMNEIHEIRQDGDVVWLGTSGGVFSHDRKTLEQKDSKTSDLLHPFIDSLAVDHTGKKWIGSYGGGVNVFDGSTWTKHPPDVTHGNTSVYSIVDQAGTVWFGTDGAGLISFDGKDWHQYTKKDGLPDDIVQAITQDKDGSLWIGTKMGGVAQLKDKVWKTYATKDGLANDNIQTIVVDRNGVKWIGTWGSGISRFDGKSWTTIKAVPAGSNAGPNSDFVLSSKMDGQGNLWFGTYDGVSMFDPQSNTWTQYREADGVLGTDVWATEIDSDGYKWFGTYKGVSRLDPANKEWKHIVH
jgi:ligand-binding sensor domain-containing protein